MARVSEIAAWLDRTLCPEKFDDVSNNGLQIERIGDEVTTVAFGVDASVEFLERAAAAGAGLCVVHHGISWGGGIRRLTGSSYETVRTAIACNLALYAAHLPLDAHPRYGNNALLAKKLGLHRVRSAFNWHGRPIGCVGVSEDGCVVGVCSGGGGGFAEEAKALGCELLVTGEADWGEKIAAENIGMQLVCLGHYETETFGVRALAPAVAKALKVKALFIDRSQNGCDF